MSKLEWSSDVMFLNWDEATMSAPSGWRLPTISELKESSESFKPKYYLSSECDKDWVKAFNFYNRKTSSVSKLINAYYVRYVREV